MRQTILTLLSAAILISTHAQSPNTPIAGWKMQENDGHYTFAPATIFGTPNIRYDVYPPQKEGGDDVATWLASLVEKDVPASGYTAVPGQAKAQDVKNFKIYSILVKDAAGMNWLLNYMAYSRPDHAIRYGRITEIPNAALVRNNMNTAVQHFIKLSKQEGGYTGSTASTDQQQSTAGSNTASAGSRPKAGTVSTG